jgi:hypothetical protein
MARQSRAAVDEHALECVVSPVDQERHRPLPDHGRDLVSSRERFERVQAMLVPAVAVARGQAVPERTRLRVRVGTQVQAVDAVRLRRQRAQVDEHARSVEAQQRLTLDPGDENGGVGVDVQPQLPVAVDDLRSHRVGGGLDAADPGLEVGRHRRALPDMRERRAGEKERRDQRPTRDEHAAHGRGDVSGAREVTGQHEFSQGRCRVRGWR